MQLEKLLFSTIYSKISIFNQICSFSLKLVIFLKICNFSDKDTKRESISLENLIFFTNFIEICDFHDFPLFNENLSFWFKWYPICFWLQA